MRCFVPAPARWTRRVVATVNGLSFGDGGLKPKTAYRYQVRAVHAGGPGPFMGIVTRQTRATVPRCAEPGTRKVVK
jgi:hypothetical protein